MPTNKNSNIGVWVGPQFFEALKADIKGVALQGVDPSAYPADLHGYMAEEGGSSAGAKSMAKMVIDYQTKCPKSAVVLSGWSQGAIVAHKALAALDFSKSKVAGLVTFGDPNHVWNKMPLPASLSAASFHSECVTGSVPDPLCASLPGDFKFPTKPSDITGPFSKLPSIAVGAQQVAAAGSLVKAFPGQLIGSFTSFASLLRPSKFVRLLLSPEHFTYGNNGMAKTAAGAVAKFAAVAAAH